MQYIWEILFGQCVYVQTYGLSMALNEWKDGVSKFGGFSMAYAPLLLYFVSPNWKFQNKL